MKDSGSHNRDKGHKVGVVLDIEEYTRILEELEELESIRMYDDAKNSNQEFIPLETALSEIERKQV